MSKGQTNPNSLANLKPQSTRTKSEQRRIAKMGGKASGESRRASASLTEAMRKQLTPELMDDITLTLIKRAKQGNLKAYELIRDQMGEKPSEKVIVSSVNEESINRLQKAIEERRKNEQTDTKAD